MLYQITWQWVNAMDTAESIELSADHPKTILNVAMAIAECRYISTIRVTDQFNQILAEITIPA